MKSSDRITKQEIEELKREIRRHEHLYYVQDAPEISDLEFDRLMLRLKQLETIHPELKTSDSPTMRVGGSPSKDFAQVKHTVPMLSLDNCYSHGELLEWDARLKKILSGEPYEFVVEAKIDGLSCSLVYSEGSLLTASTRGDGETGEDIT